MSRSDDEIKADFNTRTLYNSTFNSQDTVVYTRDSASERLVDDAQNLLARAQEAEDELNALRIENKTLARLYIAALNPSSFQS